jgi:hypothetical protein
MRNFRLEAELKIAATAAGCLESAIDDFELDVIDHRITSAAEIPAWIEKAKEQFPHRFANQTDYDAEMCQRAFVFKNLTAEMQLYKAVGEQRFNELKALYANGVPASEKKKLKLNGSADHKDNPWLGETNPKTGRYTDATITKQMSLVRAVGPEKAAAIAAAVGSRLGDLYAPGFKGVR